MKILCRITSYNVCYTKLLRQKTETSEIPIIFLTALNGTTDVVKGFQVGGNDFISKPFNKEELIIRITHQISLVAAKRIILAQTEELQKTIIGRDKLYSVIAHDLRSPVGSIKMVLNMLILNLPSSKIGEEMYELLTMARITSYNVCYTKLLRRRSARSRGSRSGWPCSPRPKR